MGNLALAVANAIKDYSEGLLSFDELYNQLDRDINNVKVKVFREDTGIHLPTYGKNGDACCDIYAKSIEYDAEKDRFIVHTGLHFALPDNYEMEIRPRSSNTKTELYLPNSVGTLDCGYRGEMLVIFKKRTNINIIHSIECTMNAVRQLSHSTNDIRELTNDAISYLEQAFDNFPYKEGDRIAQLVIRRRELIEWDEVETLEELGTTERGNGAFGHTGK